MQVIAIKQPTTAVNNADCTPQCNNLAAYVTGTSNLDPFGEGKGQQAAEQPFTAPGVVQGVPTPPASFASELFSPAEQDVPIFIGATIGHSPVRMHCGTCGYRGPTAVR